MKNKLKTNAAKAGILIVALLGVSQMPTVAATQGEARSVQCAYVVQSGDTLTRISGRFRVPFEVLQELNPAIVDVNLINAGHTFDICDRTGSRRDQREGANSAPAVTAPANVAPQLETVVAALIGNAPDWASPEDVRFLAAVTFPESAVKIDAFNHGDANSKYLGSGGFWQIRVLRNPAAHPTEPWRNWSAISGDVNAQARGAYAILRSQGRRAWGPTTNGLMPGGSCSGSSRPTSCADWFRQVDYMIAHVGGVS